MYTHVPFFFRTEGNGKWKAWFYSAWPKRQGTNRDGMQADRTLSMWTNPPYNRMKKKNPNIFIWHEYYSVSL